MAPIEITEAARRHLLEMCDLTGERAILLTVTSKGCGGHTYALRFVDPDIVGEALDLDPRRRLIVEDRSLLRLWGTRIDYQDSNLDSRMIFDNPHESGRCGCGNSFTCD